MQTVMFTRTLGEIICGLGLARAHAQKMVCMQETEGDGAGRVYVPLFGVPQSSEIRHKSSKLINMHRIYRSAIFIHPTKEPPPLDSAADEELFILTTHLAAVEL
jgi:hypothetical protein